MELVRAFRPLAAIVLVPLGVVLGAVLALAQDHIQLDLQEIVNDSTYFGAGGKVPNQYNDDKGTPVLASELKNGYGEVSVERGRFLPGRGSVLLLTIKVPSGHAGGMVHHILCIIDPISFKRISPIYFFRSDDVKRIVLPAEDQTRILYIGAYRGQCNWFHDESRVLAFSSETIKDEPIVASLSLDPETYYVEYRELDHGLFVLNLVKKELAERRELVPGHGTPVCADVQYSRAQLGWDQSTWQLLIKK